MPCVPCWNGSCPSATAADDRVGLFATRLALGRPATGSAAPAWRAARLGAVVIAAVALSAVLVVAGTPARQPAAADSHAVLGRVPVQVDPSTMPAITVDQAVLDWNHEITGPGAQEIVLTVVENLELENQALRRADETILQAVDHGERLDALRDRLGDASRTGTTEIRHYQIESVNVTLLVPFGRQDGLSLGLESRGTMRTETIDANGTTTSDPTPFATTFVVRRATGDRWLNVAELPLPAD